MSGLQALPAEPAAAIDLTRYLGRWYVIARSLAREPVIPEWSYAGLLARFAMQGYDVSRGRRVPQRREQVGRPGFE